MTFQKGHQYYPPKTEEARIRQYTGYKNIRWTQRLRKRLSVAVKNSYTPELRELRRKYKSDHPSFTIEGSRKGGQIAGRRRAKHLPKLAFSAGVKARQYEREMMEKLRPNFDYVASSSQVCDAVAIKEGQSLPT